MNLFCTQGDIGKELFNFGEQLIRIQSSGTLSFYMDG